MKQHNGGLNMFNRLLALRKEDGESLCSPLTKELDTINGDGASLAEESSDDDMGEYDYNIETNRIVNSRHHKSVKSGTRRSAYSKKAFTMDGNPT